MDDFVCFLLVFSTKYLTRVMSTPVSVVFLLGAFSVTCPIESRRSDTTARNPPRSCLSVLFTCSRGSIEDSYTSRMLIFQSVFEHAATGKNQPKYLAYTRDLTLQSYSLGVSWSTTTHTVAKQDLINETEGKILISLFSATLCLARW